MELCPLCMILLILLISVGQAEESIPVLSVQPNSPQIFSGETVTLTCYILAGSGPYNWYEDGDKVHSCTENTYIIKVNQSHKYKCYGFSYGQQTPWSNEVALSVIERPKAVLTLQPDGQIFSGEKVTFTCEIPGHADTEWTYNWYKDGVQLSSYSVNRKYSFSAVKSSSGSYTCRGWRKYDSQTSEASNAVTLTVSVRPKPVVSINPDNQVYRGETVTLRCDIQDKKISYLNYRWNKDGSGVSSEQEYRISSAEMTHTGKYTCRGRERGGSHSSHTSDAVTLTVSEKRKPKLTSDTNGAALTGNSVTLTCTLNLQSNGWTFYWIKDTQSTETETETDTHSYTIRSVSVSDGGQYRCRAGRGNPVYYTHYSDALWVNVTESTKAVVTIKPDNHVFRGESVTLRCEIQGGGDTEWTYSWYKNNNTVSPEHTTEDYNLSSVRNDNGGKYTCRGRRSSDSQSSEISDALTLTVSDRAETVVSVSPLSWLTEGDSVTLSCEVKHSSTGWTFSWYTDVPYRDSQGSLRYRTALLSDSSRGSGGSYTLSPVTLNHTGVYMCRAERGEPVFHTHYSEPQPLFVTVGSPPVSLIISPSRTQHFTADSLSLSCEDQRDSTGWTVRRYTHSETLYNCSSVSGSTCNISSLSTSHTGVYWCQSESGGRSNSLNITVHNGDVILESPVHPVTEGNPLTLHCLYHNTKISDSGADFYKDGSVLQKQTTGEMTISSVSKSDEGFYHCTHPERGESPKSWVSVRGSGFNIVIVAVAVGVSLTLLFIILFLILVWKHKCNKRKDRDIQHNSNQAPDWNLCQTGAEYLQSGIAALKTDNDAGSIDVTYIELELKPQKKARKYQVKTNAESETVYSELKINTQLRVKGLVQEPNSGNKSCCKWLNH
ncbi:Fc receptor-like protein 5 [Clarias gariepinus]|uniref:Fc receptor-like protein 5 n=1 Tax=Clarias gariepinus TaxID=13013 RepID=UPI00234E2D63|nr:Fc receptor-like protein 5 [Clarias gariepinus]